MKVAIIGTAPSSRDLAPFSDPSWQIWACSPGNSQLPLPRVNVWFEIHPRAHLTTPENRPWGEPYIRWLSEQAFPVFTLAPWPELPRARVYPLADVVHEFSPHFLTSAPVYMMAKAILDIEEARRNGDDGPHEMGLWGIDMAVADEYAEQRPGCKVFILEAMRRGITVHLPPQCDLMTQTPLYGYLDESPQWIKMSARKRELEGQMQAAERTLEEAKYRFAFFKGALDDLNYMMRTWVSGQDSPSARAQMRKGIAHKTNGAEAPPVVNGSGEALHEEQEQHVHG